MKSLPAEIESLRPRLPHTRPSPWSTPSVLVSLEPDGQGTQVETTTVFLIGAECPFRCSMCDLWQYTTLENTPVGAIPHQLSQVLQPQSCSQRRWLKLYNASNFFDPRSIPREDYAAIAGHCSGFERVIVENHPCLCNDSMRVFSEQIDGQLEVAMGLETIHPGAMAVMNKRMTLEDYDLAVETCLRFGIDLRAFALLQPPGIALVETIQWTWKTVEYAFARGVRHVSVIPLRSGNGWMDRLIANGEYQLPTVSTVRSLYESFPKLEWKWPSSSVFEFDLWDWDSLHSSCQYCSSHWKSHIEQCNRTQQLVPFHNSETQCACTV